ncbi:hypothetical protein [Segatella copri]|jgi:hypothetical protein|uniref:hypothetical protein n=1 Tax=Segatella copri TaxID=165179 RepID=UPI0012919C2D|nr:hypothetical protein [Segatella copri]DAU89979.1 MAG TPA: hypothetical protein [Caudoviricetes sp.]MQM90293.1 hypothetical protein [Segatella copri]MQM95788.1 hypothetical protein [Segatella copri]MQN03829.1 hypothetical protein [Segatella copri]MQN16055.1 hypothetical protein [Segatella copri]
MNITELKEKLLESVDVWADARIDDMVKGNPMLAIPSVYMKRAAHNIISKNKDKWDKSIDNATLFLADENGNIDADTIFTDAMQMLKVVENYHFDFGVIHGHIDNGTISIDLPDNPFIAILFGSKRSINFTEEDFVELKDLITA